MEEVDMTDLVKVAALFTELGIGFTIGPCEMGWRWMEEHQNPTQSLSCAEGSPKVDGYHYFVTRFFFDQEGKFVVMGAWE
ncbi:MAG: hypothetical protein WC657_06605 [Candidatus Paceibacterota bacterium]|jgi:hypothetical protein